MKQAPRLIGLSGYAGCGKDTFAAALSEAEGYEVRSFAEPIRQMLYAMNPQVQSEYAAGYNYQLRDIVNAVGWEYAKGWPEVRRLLQSLGTEAGRGILGEDVWVNTAMGAQRGKRTVFKDVRFRNEAQEIVNRGGIVVNIQRDGVGPLGNAEGVAHQSETSMDDWDFDYVIHNDGDIPALRQQAMDLVAKEKGTYDWGRAMSALIANGTPEVRLASDQRDPTDPFYPGPEYVDYMGLFTVPTLRPRSHYMDRLTLPRRDLQVGDYSPGKCAMVDRIEHDTTRFSSEQERTLLHRDQVTVFWDNGEVTTADAAAQHTILRSPQGDLSVTDAVESVSLSFDPWVKTTPLRYVGSEL